MDPFHVVQWAMDALDELRREVWREAYDEAQRVKKEHPRKAVRPNSHFPIENLKLSKPYGYVCEGYFYPPSHLKSHKNTSAMQDTSASVLQVLPQYE